LMPGKSFVEWLTAQGWDVWIIDWGTPEAEDRFVSFDDICDRQLGRALRAVERSTSMKPHVLGYCMGGTLVALHASVYPERFRSVVALAAPVHFPRGSGILETWTQANAFDVDALVAGFGNVPWPLMQFAFHMMRPTLGLSKSVHLVDRAWDDEFLDGFLALETWGNDNVSFPGEAYRTYIKALYRDDRFANGDMVLGGKPARLEAIRSPLLAITFEHDNIVPAVNAKALPERASSTHKEHIHLPGGHVGAVVSKAASKRLWPQITTFLERVA
jgi:polyhydroxyalkanoate synthase subunit PhaC